MSSPAHGPRHRRTVPRRVYVLRRLLVLGVAVLFLAGVSIAVVALVSDGKSGSSAAASSTSSSTSTTPTTAPVTRNAVTLSFVGDMDLGSEPGLAPNAAHYLDPVKSALSAPTEFGNLEGTLTVRGTSKCGGPNTNSCYAFRNPPAFAHIYRAAGFNVLNSANNHSHDFGEQGALDTTAALASAGIVQAGLPGQIGYITQGKTTIAFCDFAPYANTNDLLNFSAAQALIAKAKQHAQIVVVYMHAGAEGATVNMVTGQSEYYFGENRGNPEAFAKMAINAGASLVVASGPHTLRGMQFYKGHLIAYSLGDFVSYNNFSTYGNLALSGVLHVTLSANGTFSAAHFVAVRMNSVGQPHVDPSNAATAYVASLSHKNFGSTAAVVSAAGTITAPAKS